MDLDTALGVGIGRTHDMPVFHTSDGRTLSITDLPSDSMDIYVPTIRLSRVDDDETEMLGKKWAQPTESSNSVFIPNAYGDPFASTRENPYYASRGVKRSHTVTKTTKRKWPATVLLTNLKPSESERSTVPEILFKKIKVEPLTSTVEQAEFDVIRVHSSPFCSIGDGDYEVISVPVPSRNSRNTNARRNSSSSLAAMDFREATMSGTSQSEWEFQIEVKEELKVDTKEEITEEEPSINPTILQHQLSNVVSAATRAANGLRAPNTGALNYGGYWLENFSGEEDSGTDNDLDYEPDTADDDATATTISATTKSTKREVKGHPKPPPRRKRILNACRICSVEFPTQAQLKAHWKTKEHAKRAVGGKRRNEELYPCSFCGEVFNRRKVRNEHVASHKAYSCKICGSKFTQSQQVGVHMRIHTGEMPYRCTKCEKRFNQKTHLQRHMKIHSGDLPFSCHKCTMRFNQKCNLVRHLNAHDAGTLRHLPTK